MMKTLIAALSLFMSTLLIAASSEENRSAKKIETTLQLASQDYRLQNVAIAGMYFLTPNDLLGLKLGSLRGQENQDSIALQYKKYFSNSFYIAPEIFYLRTHEDVYGFWGDVFDQHDYATHTSMGAGIRIGNQWSWKSFTLGCDWIGIGQRFGTFRKDTHRLQDTTFTLLNLIVGVSW